MFERLTLLLTDVVDSTAMNVSLGDGAMQTLWREHDRLSRGLIRRHGGREIGRTDGFLVTFSDVAGAAGFAADYHRLLDAIDAGWRGRVGIHVGEVELRANAPDDVAAGATPYDVDGVALPVAARICALARGRQTLVSAAARTDLGHAVQDPCSHGHWRLKGLAEPMELFEIGDERAEFLPPEDGDKGYRVILDEEGGWRPAREIRHTLPAERDTFFGRAAELRHLSDLVASGARMISVVGTGGMGKTRLVTRFVRQWLGDFAGGAWFCDLSEARDQDGIHTAVGLGLDIALAHADPRGRIAEAIAGRHRCVVILDNFEQVSALAAATLGHWLDRASEAVFITTTRERLGLAGEQVLRLHSMDTAAAARMFVRRASVQRPEWLADGADGRAIERLVERLDGLPLAIELAAGRAHMMSPQAMLTRLDHRYALLARKGRTDRQSTLLAAFDWSWELLNAEEQRLLAQTSVFAGGFTLEAAEQVLWSEAEDRASAVFETLGSLVEKSFLRVVDDRFTLLVSVREYAAGKLLALARGDPDLHADELEARHAAWFARPPVPAATADPQELENVLTAARRAIARADVAVIAPLCENAWQILETRGPVRVAVELVEAALALAALPGAVQGRLHFIVGRSLLVAGDAGNARVHLASAREQADASGSVPDRLRALTSLAELHLIAGEVDEARLQFEQAVEGAEWLDDAPLRCATLNGLGVYHDHVGEFESARRRFREALAVARRTADGRWEGCALSNLGHVEANLGNREAARQHYDEAIVIARRLDDRVWEGNLLCNLGLFKLEGGQLDAARLDLAHALRLAREGGLSLLESVVLCNLGLVDETSGAVAEAERAYRDALAVARRRGDSRSQGQFLGYLGLVVARRGALEEGRELLREGLVLLRRVKDALSLGIALCRYAEGCALWEETPAGRAALDEAQAIADAVSVAPGSELALALQAARRALPGPAIC